MAKATDRKRRTFKTLDAGAVQILLGSGETQNTRNQTFLDVVADLQKQGMSPAEIAKDSLHPSIRSPQQISLR